MRLTLIITSLIFFALLTYAKLMSMAQAPAVSLGGHHDSGFYLDHSAVLAQQSN